MYSGYSARLAVMYRIQPPQPSKNKNGVSIYDYFEEFAEFIDSLDGQWDHLLVLDGLSIHWEKPGELDTIKFNELLD